MPIQTAKSHKSRKTAGEPGKPRQRTSSGSPLKDPRTLSSSLVVSSSSDVPATPASSPPDIVATVDTPAVIDMPKEGTSAPEVGTTEQGLVVQPLIELPREKQPWYRPADSKLRAQAEKISVMRAAGHRGPAIAKRLKTSEGNVRFVEYVARKNGWYDDDDQPIDVEAELTYSIDRKIVRNISASLDGEMTNWQTHEMTLAGARGRGMFKTDKGEVGPMQLPVVAIQIVMPAIGAEDQVIVNEADIGGVPIYIEGDVVDGTS